jgi:hypothetical protein
VEVKGSQEEKQVLALDTHIPSTPLVASAAVRLRVTVTPVV